MPEFQPIIPVDNTLGAQPEQNNRVPSVAQPDVYQNGGVSETPDVKGMLGNFINANQAKYLEPIPYDQQAAAKYPKYNVMLDNEENYAANQSWYSKWGHGIAKMGALTLGTFAEGMMSIPDVIRGVSGGNVYKNSWAQSIDNWEQNLENVFPNYYTHWEQDHPIASFFTPTGFANAWSDKFLKNIGYTVGAIGAAAVTDLAVGAVTEGLGEIPLLGNQIGKAALYLNKLFSAESKVGSALGFTESTALTRMMSEAKTLGASEESLFTMKQLAANAASQKFSRGAEYMATLYGASHAEAAMEARQGYNQVKKDLTEQYVRENGHSPIGADAEKIEQYATASGNYRYGANIALLMASNAIQFEHILKPWNSYKQSLKGGVQAVTAEQKGAIGLAEDALKTASDVDKLAVLGSERGKIANIWNNYVKPSIPNILAEGVYEEGGQFAAENATRKYFEDKYNNKIKGNLDDVINSTVYGLGEQFGTTEGYENMFIGGLTGMFMGPIESKIEARQRASAGVLSPEAATNAALNNLNQQGVTGLFTNNYNNAAQTLSNSVGLQAAVKSNDVFKFQNLKADSFFNFVMSGIQNNRYDVRKEQLEMLKSLPNDEINKLLGIEDGTQRDNIQYIDKLIAKSDEIKKSHDAIASVFSNPYTYRGKAETDDHIKENEAWKSFEDYKAALVKFAYNSNDFASRISEIDNSIKEINPLLTANMVASLNDPRSLNNLKVEYRDEANTLQKQIDDNTIPVKDRAAVRDRINTLNTHAHNIDKFFDGKYDHLQLFPQLADFEINNRNPNGSQSIDKTQAANLINYGHDLNRINLGKKYAAAAYDHLLTQEGFNDFVTNHKEWSDSLNLDENFKPEEETTKTPEEEPITVGDNSFEPNRTYKATKALTYTISKSDDVWHTKDPFGNVDNSFKTKEEAEQARDDANANIANNLSSVKILGTENGKIKVEDVNGKIQFVDPRLLSAHEKVMSDAEIVAARTEFNKELERQQKALAQNDPDTVSQSEEIAASDSERENPKKLLEYLFNSTTYNANDSKEYVKRTQAFLSNIDRFDAKLKPNLRAIIVTASNEGHLNLNGLTTYLVSGTDIDRTNVEQGPIAVVFAEQSGDTLHYLNSNGERVGRVGDPTDLNEIVFATLPTADLSYRNNPNEKRYPSTESDELALQYSKNWAESRKELFKITDNYPIYSYYVTRGVPYRTKDSEGNYEMNSVVDTLVNRKDLRKQGLVIVSNGTVSHLGRNMKFPKGATLLQNGYTLEWLNNRKLTASEIQTIEDALISLAEHAEANNGELNKEIINYLQGVVYYGAPKENKKVSPNQIYLSIDGNIHIGDNALPFTANYLRENKHTELEDALLNIYTNSNSTLLAKNAPFREITSINGDNITAITWKSYQHYLISDKYDVDNEDMKGKSRGIDNIPFRTSVRKISKDIGDSNYKYKSAVLIEGADGRTLFEVPKVKEVVTNQPKSAHSLDELKNKKKGKYVLDGETANPFKVTGGDIIFYAKESPEGYLIDYDRTNTIFTELITRLSNDTKFIEKLRAVGNEGTTEELAEGYVSTKIITALEEEKNPKKVQPAKVTGKALSTFTTKSGAVINYSIGEIKGTQIVNIEEDESFNKLVESTPEATYEVLRKSIGEDDFSKEELLKAYLGGTIMNSLNNKETIAPTTAQEEVIKKEVKKVETVKKEKKVKKDKPSSGMFNTDFRLMVDGYNYTIANIEKEEKWWKDNLSLPINRVENLIKTTGGGYAFGMFYDGAAYIYKNAETGTTYHEAFHAVWTMFADTKERSSMIDEFRSRNGNFIERSTGESISFSKATEQQINEQLAEEFRDYKETGKLFNKPEKSKNFIYRFFEALMNFFKKLFSGNVTIEDMFKKIDSGYYKTASPNQVYDSAAQYSTIPGLNVTDTYKITKGITAAIIQNLFKDNRNLVEFDTSDYTVANLFDKVKTEYKALFTSDEYADYIPSLHEAGKINDVQRAQYDKLWDTISNNWGEVSKQVSDYLRTFNIIADLSQESVDSLLEEDSNLKDKEGESSEYAGRNADSYVANPFVIDASRNASTSVKLLLATIADAEYVDGKVQSKIDKSTMMQSMVNYSKMFNFLLNQLYNLNTFAEKRERILDIAKTDATYGRLANRLKLNGQDLTLDDYMLQAKFFNVFSKQRPYSFVHYVDGRKSVITATNLNSAANKLIQSWLSAIKIASKEEGTLITNKNGVYKFNGKVLRTASVRNAVDQMKFLERLGVDFTQAMYSKLSNADKNKFAKSTQGLHHFLSKIKEEDEFDITSNSLESAGHFTSIAELWLKANSDSDSTFYSIEGEKMQMFVQQNAISNMTNDFNNVPNKDALFELMPFLKQDFRSDSYYINEYLFHEDGERTSNTLSIGYTQGVVYTKQRKQVPNSALSHPQRVMEEINQNLNKNYYILVPADSKTEWMLEMAHVISFNDFDNSDINKKIYGIFNKYYHTERDIAHTNGKLDEGYKSLMYDIAGGYKATDLNEDKLIKYIDANVASIIDFLKDNNIITERTSGPNKEGTGKFTIKDMNSAFLKSNKLNKEFTQEELEKLFKFSEVNYMINNIEIHKLFFGDINNIKDPLKRYKSFLSPRETSIYNYPEFNNALNEQLNVAHGEFELKETDYGYWNHKEFMKTVTMADIDAWENSIMNDPNISDKVKKGYDTINSADAQSWGFLPAYREILWKNGGRFTKEQEALYQFLTAQDRLLLEEDGHYDYGNEDSDGAEFKAADQALVNKGYKGNAKLYIVKPIGSGITEEGNTFLDKTSLAPLSYALVRGTNMEAHYLKMWKQGISYIIVESGRKIGKTTTDTFYNEDGSVNKKDYSSIIDIPFRYYGVQVETAGEHSTNTLGTQLTKEVSLNLRNAGVPIDYKGDVPWSELTEAQKLESPIYKLISRNNQSLKEMQNNGYEDLLDILGIEDTGNEFIAPDKTKVIDLLKSELLRREAPQNLKDALALNEDGTFKVPFEAIPNYKQIKDMLFSYVDKKITKLKVNGGPRIQLSGSLFESGNREIKEVKTKKGTKSVLVSSGLKFYEAIYDENGNRTSVSRMEVMIPMWFADKIRKHPRWKNKTDDEILEYLNNTDEGKNLLNGVGFRIPTQELNSAEAFTVKKFTPSWLGDSIIVPEAITTKSGSDFDVDKLNTYLKNIYLDSKGDIKVVPFLGYGQQAIDKFKKIIDSFDTSEDLADYLLDNKARANENAIENFDFVQNEQRVTSLAKKMYKQSIENEYFTSLEEMLLLPDNFERLIRPNSADEFKAVRDELVEIAPNEFGSSTTESVLNRQYMSKMRHLFIVGKGGVGIAAVAQTNNALNQSSNIYLNPENLSLLPELQRDYLRDGSIMIPHNTAVAQGGTYATLSGMKEAGKKNGNYISDNTSMYIDGFVDIAKDPWISQIIQHPTLTSTFILTTKFGTDLRTTGFFMNQPIIREYMKTLLANGSTWLYISKNINDIRKPFMPSAKTIQNLKSLASADEMKEMIRKYYNRQKLTEDEKAQQQVILTEFLKYSILAGNVFDMHRGYSYDTDSAADPNLQYRKQKLTLKAQNANIFTSVDDIMENTHLGNAADKVGKASRAIGESFTIINSPTVRPYINAVIDELPNRLGKDKYSKAARAIEESFITYLVQTNSGLNNRMKELLVDTQTAISTKIMFLKKRLSIDEKLAKSDLADNIFLKELMPLAKNKKAEVKNLMVAHKVFDAFTSDTYTGALRELRDNPITKELYGDLIRLSFLQSGISNSPISFHKFIPSEDYASAIAPILGRIDTLDNLQEFVDLGMFFRNNWNNTDVVPNLREEFKVDFNSGQDVSKQRLSFGETAWFRRLKDKYNIKDAKYIPYKLDHQKNLAQNKYITFTTTQTYAVQTVDGYTSTEVDTTLLLRRLDNEDGEPIRIPYPPSPFTGRSNGYYYAYIPINPLGDGFRAQEYYSHIQPSVISTDAYKVAHEFSQQEIRDAFFGINEDNLESTPESGNFAESESTEQPKIETTPIVDKFKPLTEWKKSPKKEIFRIVDGNGEFHEVSGYRVTFDNHPNFKVFVYGEKKSWTMSEESSGKSIDYGTSIKDAISRGVEKINNIVNSKTANIKVLNEIGLSKEENTINNNITPEEGTDETCPF